MKWKKIETGEYRVNSTTIKIKRSENSPEIVIVAHLGGYVMQSYLTNRTPEGIKFIVENAVRQLENWYNC